MCKRCAKRALNLKRRRTLTVAKARALIGRGRFVNVPLFAERADNYLIEAVVYWGQRRRTDRRHQRRNIRQGGEA